MPDGSDGVNDKGGWQIAARSLYGFARWEMAIAGYDLTALFKDRGTTCAMDCSIDTTSAHQAGIRSIDD
jgi:hypothetical protein